MAAALLADAISTNSIYYPFAADIDRSHRSLAQWLGEEGAAHFVDCPRDILLNTRSKS